MTKERELTWIEAIQKVLQEEKRALHFTEIAEIIIKKNIDSMLEQRQLIQLMPT